MASYIRKSVKRSNKAHSVLEKRAIKNGLNRLANYHRHCINSQRTNGRVLPINTRTKIYDRLVNGRSR